MKILAIDPGPFQSAFVIWNGRDVSYKQILMNTLALDALRSQCLTADAVVCEKIQSFGMSVGSEIFDTCYFSGRLLQLTVQVGRSFYLVPRLKVKMHLCHSAQAKDGNVRQALIDRFGPPTTTTIEERTGKNGKPIKPAKVRVPGVTYGLHDDLWAAFALAVTAHDRPDILAEHIAP